MTRIDDGHIDEVIIDAFDDIVADEQLKKRTLEAIHAKMEVGVTAEGLTMLSALGDSDGQRSHDGGSNIAGSAATHMVKRSRPAKQAISLLIAACLALSFIGVGGFTLYRSETAYASIVAQSSLTLGINRFGTVVSVRAGNDSEQAVLDELGLTGLTYADAMDRLASSDVFGDTQVDVTVGANVAAQQDQLADTTQNSLANAGCSGICNGNRYGADSGVGVGNGDDMRGTDQSVGQGAAQGANDGNGQRNGRNGRSGT